MATKLEERLGSLTETLTKATSMDAANEVVCDTERMVLRSVFDARQSGNDNASYTAQDYLIGERNTRGLSWKLNLLREVAAANFCHMKRIGVHGGTVQILGQPENITTTLAIYDALVAAYPAISQAAYTSYSDGRAEDKDAPAVHKVGWVNAFLVDAPAALGLAINAQREQDAGSNIKLARVLTEKNEALQAFKTSLAPAPAPKTPKAPKAPKTPKGDAPATAGDPVDAAMNAAAPATEAPAAEG